MLKLSEVDVDDLVGAVLHKGEWRIFAGVVADWILSYSKYAPSDAVEAKRAYFRNGVIDVTDDNVE